MNERDLRAVLSKYFYEEEIEKISEQSSLYHDLQLRGDDAHDFLSAVNEAFGTNFDSFIFEKYFPPEAFVVPFFSKWRWEKRIKSDFTIGHLKKVIQKGYWFEPTYPAKCKEAKL